MTFEAAEKKLKKIAKDAYRSIGYEVTTFSSGEKHPECRVYIDGYSGCTGRTWKDAFNLLDIEINGHSIIDTNEEPKGNDDE